jgi:hypothetical protein
MKKVITTKEFVSLAIIAITAPLFALALISGIRTVYATGNEVFLLALTLCGAVVSGVNGFGRRTVDVEHRARASRRGSQTSVTLNS